jgi:hypothetical protein
MFDCSGQILNCHHPRKRMIQQSPPSKIGNRREYWMPACAGMTMAEGGEIAV